MSTEGEGSRVNLVACMQPRGDLQGILLMFDHYKHVSGWIIMARHIYNPICARVMTIAIYDTQLEDVDPQILMWKALVKVMKAYGFDEP
jgi:hypothetical protein